jgi:hypothetical protein
MRIARLLACAALACAASLACGGCGREAGAEGKGDVRAETKKDPYQGYKDPRRNLDPSTDSHLNPKP